MFTCCTLNNLFIISGEKMNYKKKKKNAARCSCYEYCLSSAMYNALRDSMLTKCYNLFTTCNLYAIEFTAMLLPKYEVML